MSKWLVLMACLGGAAQGAQCGLRPACTAIGCTANWFACMHPRTYVLIDGAPYTHRVHRYR
jgi:hypothetical protein